MAKSYYSYKIDNFSRESNRYQDRVPRKLDPRDKAIWFFLGVITGSIVTAIGAATIYWIVN